MKSSREISRVIVESVSDVSDMLNLHHQGMAENNSLQSFA